MSIRVVLVWGAWLSAWVLFAMACGGAAAPAPAPTNVLNPPNLTPGPDAAPTEVTAQLPPTPAVTSPDVIEIEMRGFAFLPAEITVHIGDSVRWTNQDAASHTATSGAPGELDAGELFDGPFLSQGDDFSQAFDQPGTVEYFCRVHPDTMQGSIMVETAAQLSGDLSLDQIPPSSSFAYDGPNSYQGTYQGGIADPAAAHQFELSVGPDGKVSGRSWWPATGAFALTGLVQPGGSISFEDDSTQLLGFRGGIYEGNLKADGGAEGVYYERTREQESWRWTAERRNSSGVGNRYDSSPTAPPVGTEPMGSDSREVRLEKVSVVDPAAGGEAFTFLKPSGWTVEGGVVWRLELSNLASSAIEVRNPAGIEGLEVFPIVPYTWQEGGIAFFPQEKIYLGSVVQPPIYEPAEFIDRVVLPAYRGHLNPRIIDWSETPGVSEEVAGSVQEAGLTKTVRSGRVRVEYSLGGTPIHEDFYVTLVFAQSPLGPFVLWGPERLYSFRAQRGELDRASPLLHTVVFSTQVNRRWLNEYLQVVNLWQEGQLQAIRDAGEISRYIARVNAEIQEITSETFEQQQETNERVSRQYSEMIRGVEHYDDPFKSEEVELPSGYDSVWASETGEYILSNNALLDPNLGSIVSWQRLRVR